MFWALYDNLIAALDVRRRLPAWFTSSTTALGAISEQRSESWFFCNRHSVCFFAFSRISEVRFMSPDVSVRTSSFGLTRLQYTSRCFIFIYLFIFYTSAKRSRHLPQFFFLFFLRSGKLSHLQYVKYENITFIGPSTDIFFCCLNKSVKKKQKEREWNVNRWTKRVLGCLLSFKYSILVLNCSDFKGHLSFNMYI